MHAGASSSSLPSSSSSSLFCFPFHLVGLGFFRSTVHHHLSFPKRNRRGGSPSGAIATAHQPSTMFLLDWCEAKRADPKENDARRERTKWIARGEGRSRGRGLTRRNDRTAKVLRRAQRTWTVEQEREDPVLGAWETEATTCTWRSVRTRAMERSVGSGPRDTKDEARETRKPGGRSGKRHLLVLTDPHAITALPRARRDWTMQEKPR